MWTDVGVEPNKAQSKTVNKTDKPVNVHPEPMNGITNQNRGNCADLYEMASNNQLRSRWQP